MRIGLLGGSFNPPHFGHLHVSQLAIKKLKLGQLWWIPTAQNPNKSKDSYLPLNIRIQLCKEILSSSQKIHLKLIENFYTIDLVKKLKKTNPNHEFIWIGGNDLMINLHRWRLFKKLINEVSFAIFARNPKLNFVKSSKAFSIFSKHNLGKNSSILHGFKPYLSMAAPQMIASRRLPKLSIFRNPICDISSSKIRILLERK